MDTLVNLHCFIDIENCNVAEVNLGSSRGIKRKKEAQINDESGCTKLTLWEELIKKVSHSGVYHICGVRIKSYMSQRCLSTTPGTIITVSETPIAKVEATIKELEFNLPFFAIVSIAINKHCILCNKMADTLGEFVKCKSCGCKTLSSKVESKVIVKALVEDRFPITIFDKQIREFCELTEIACDDLDVIEETLLKDSNVKVKYNSETAIAQCFVLKD